MSICSRVGFESELAALEKWCQSGTAFDIPVAVLLMGGPQLGKAEIVASEMLKLDESLEVVTRDTFVVKIIVLLHIRSGRCFVLTWASEHYLHSAFSSGRRKMKAEWVLWIISVLTSHAV